MLAGEVHPSNHGLISHVTPGCCTVCVENGGGLSGAHGWGRDIINQLISLMLLLQKKDVISDPVGHLIESVGVQVIWAKTAVWSQGFCKWSAYEMEMYVKHQFNFFPPWTYMTTFSIAEVNEIGPCIPLQLKLIEYVVTLSPYKPNLLLLFSLTSIVWFLLSSCAVWRWDTEKQLRDLIPSSGVSRAAGCRGALWSTVILVCRVGSARQDPPGSPLTAGGEEEQA